MRIEGPSSDSGCSTCDQDVAQRERKGEQASRVATQSRGLEHDSNRPSR